MSALDRGETFVVVRNGVPVGELMPIRRSTKIHPACPKQARTGVIEFERIAPELLPGEIAISAVALAELAVGPHATMDAVERAKRQDKVPLAPTSRRTRATPATFVESSARSR
ncbi:MAG TPA: hypothetical protein VMK83_11470 [Gaiellaceae bacterium]|nr:hypothetical protein [Gaiellaceae bacterium]